MPKSGFSLFELLVVIAVITTLATLAAPAISGLFQQNFSGKLENMNFLIRQAKSTAMAQNTFVWLGFSASTANGSPSVVVTAVASNNGLASGLSSGNYSPVMKPIILSNLRLVASSYLALPGINSLSNSDIATSTYSFSQMVGGQNTAFTSVIAFSPDGSASLNTNGPSRCIGIGLQVGPSSASQAQVAAIQVSGLNAQPTLFRQ